MKRSRLNILPAIFSLLMLVTATGCRDAQVTHTLARAEAVMEEHPDSARRLLDGIDPARLHRADIPLYAVLDAQSRHKLDLPATSDSLLDIAVDRYTSHGPDSLLMKALFYRAVGHQEREDMESATKDATFAWDIASSFNSYYWKAKTAELIADLYHEGLNITEEIKWRQDAAISYKEAGKTNNYLFCQCDLISCYGNIGKIEQALSLVDSIRPLISTRPDAPSLKSYYYGYAVPVYSRYGDTEVARQLMDSLHNSTDERVPTIYEVYLARIKSRNGDAKGALDILNTAYNDITSSLDSLMFLGEYMYLFRSAGDYRKAYLYADTIIKKQYELFHESMAQPVAITQRDLYASRYSKENSRADRQRNYVVVLAIIGGILIIAVPCSIYITRLRKRREARRIKEKMVELAALCDEMRKEQLKNSYLSQNKDLASTIEDNIQAVQSVLSDTRRQIQLQMETQEMLYRQKWESLNKLCMEISRSDKPEDRELIMKNLRTYIESFRETAQFKDIEESVNRYMNNLMVRLRTQCTFLKENDFVFLTLLYAGLSAKSIAFFTDIKLSYVYTKRDRLYSRILKSDAADKEEFTKRIKEN